MYNLSISTVISCCQIIFYDISFNLVNNQKNTKRWMQTKYILQFKVNKLLNL